MIRRCIGCNAEIMECMGFGLARDIVAIFDGKRQIAARELCGKCVFRCEFNPQLLTLLTEES